MQRANRQVLMRLILVEYTFNVKFIVYILVRYPEKAFKIGNMRKNTQRERSFGTIPE